MLLWTRGQGVSIFHCILLHFFSSSFNNEKWGYTFEFYTKKKREQFALLLSTHGNWKYEYSERQRITTTLTDWLNGWKEREKNHRNISFSLPLFCLSYWDCSVFQPEPHTYTTHAHTFPWLSVKVKLYEAIWIKYARLAQRCAHMLVCGCNAWLKVSATRCHDTNTRTYCALHCIFCVHCKYVYIQYQFRLDAFCSFLHRSFARL